MTFTTTEITQKDFYHLYGLQYHARAHARTHTHTRLECVIQPEADLRKKASLATNQEGPLPSPFPSPPLLFHPLPSPFPSRPLPLEVGPLFAARGSGGALKLPQRVRAEPGRQTHFGAF